jgi:hypothetical protein
MKAKRYVVTHKRTPNPPLISCHRASFPLKLTNTIHKILTEQYSFVKATKERLLVQKTGHYLEKFDFDMLSLGAFVWSPMTGTSDVMNSLSSLGNQRWVMSFVAWQHPTSVFWSQNTAKRVNKNEICGLMMLNAATKTKRPCPEYKSTVRNRT